MLIYSVCYYYTKNNKKNIDYHIKCFNKIDEANKIFIINCMIDSDNHSEAINDLENYLEKFNIQFKILTSFNWGGTILGLWIVYKYFYNNIDSQLFQNTYIAHFEEDFVPHNHWFYKASKRRIDLWGRRYIYVGETITGKIKKGNSDQRNPKIKYGRKKIADFEVWTDGGYYFSNLENLKKIEDKIGIFHKGDQNTKYHRYIDGIDLGEVGFPTLVHHAGFKFYALKRVDYFVHNK